MNAKPIILHEIIARPKTQVERIVANLKGIVDLEQLSG